MCDPISMMVVAGVASTGLSVAGDIMSGQAAADAGKLQQKAYNQQAQADQQASAFEMARERHKQELLHSAAVAQVGASGVGLTGSPSEVLTAQAGEGQLDIEAIKYGSALRQNNLRTQGKIAAYGGKQTQAASYFKAGTDFVSGITGTYTNAVKMGANPFA